MSIGENLDQIIKQLEDRISVLEEQQIQLKQIIELFGKKQSVQSIQCSVSDQSIKNDLNATADEDKIVTSESPKLLVEHQSELSEMPLKEVVEPLRIPMGNHVIYAFAEGDSDGVVSLFDAGIDYKENAVCLLESIGNDQADVYFNPYNMEQALPNLESHVLPYFDCDIQSGQNIPSTIICTAKGTAKLVDEKKWELIQKAKILIT